MDATVMYISAHLSVHAVFLCLSPGPSLVHGLRGGLRHQRGRTCHYQLQALTLADENRWVKSCSVCRPSVCPWESAYLMICRCKVLYRVTSCCVQMWHHFKARWRHWRNPYTDCVAERFITWGDGIWTVTINFQGKPRTRSCVVV